MTDVYSHPDYQQFLARIRERPDDDVVRLVCADWLEDWVDANHPHPQSGEAESRAELIRVQCDPLYTVPCGQVTYPLDGMAGQEPLWDMGVTCLDYQDGRSERQDRWCPQCKARHRVLQMIEAGDDDTTRHVPHPFSANGWTGFVVKTYDRGFVHTVRGPLASLHGGECVAACPETGNICDGGRTTAPNPAFTRECRSCHGTGRTHGVLPLLLRREPIGCDGIEVTDFKPIQIGGSWSLAQWRLTPGQRDLAASLPYETFPTTDAARLALSRSLYSIHAPKIEVSR